MDSEIKINMVGSYANIEIAGLKILISNIDVDEIKIKNNDNGKPIIIVESKQQ